MSGYRCTCAADAIRADVASMLRDRSGRDLR